MLEPMTRESLGFLGCFLACRTAVPAGITLSLVCWAPIVSPQLPFPSYRNPGRDYAEEEGRIILSFSARFSRATLFRRAADSPKCPRRSHIAALPKNPKTPWPLAREPIPRDGSYSHLRDFVLDSAATKTSFAFTLSGGGFSSLSLSLAPALCQLLRRCSPYLTAWRRLFSCVRTRGAAAPVDAIFLSPSVGDAGLCNSLLHAAFSLFSWVSDVVVARFSRQILSAIPSFLWDFKVRNLSVDLSRCFIGSFYEALRWEVRLGYPPFPTVCFWFVWKERSLWEMENGGKSLARLL